LAAKLGTFSFSAIPKRPPPVVGLQLLLQLIAHRRLIAGSQIHLRLPHIANPRDDCRNRLRLEGKLERGRRQVGLGCSDCLLHLRHALHRPLQAVSRKIAVANITLFPARRRREIPCQRALIKRDAYDHAHTMLDRNRKELRLRLLLENVVDHLHRIEPAISHQIDQGVLIVLGSADADAAKLSFVLEFAKGLQSRRLSVPGARPGVKLDDVDAIGLKVAKTPLQPLAKVRLGISIFDAVVGTGRPVSRRRWDFGGDVDALTFSLMKDLCNRALASPIAVSLSRIDEIATQIQGAIEGGDGISFTLRSPTSADRPSTKANFRHFPAQSTERAVFHSVLP